MQARTVALVGLLGLGLGWALGGRAPAGTPGESTTGARTGGARPLGVSLNTPFAPPEPLRTPRAAGSGAPRDTAPDAPRPTRNPFAFGERRAAAAATRPAERAADEPSTEPPPAPSEPPPLRLSGMATTTGVDGAVYTAIVHDGGTMLFLKRGDRVREFEVVDVQESSVTLRDASGGERTLVLR